MTVEQWSATWQGIYPGRRGDDTRQHNEHMIAPFVRAHGSKRLDAVTALLAQQWAVKHPGQVRYLRLMFAKAVKADLLERNVWDGVELPATPGKPRRPPTLDELERMKAAARELWPGDRGEHYADLLDVVAYSGLRLGGVAGLRLYDVLGPTRVWVTEKGERTRQSAVFGPGCDALTRALARRWPHTDLMEVDPSHPWLARLVWVSPQRQPFDKHSLGRVYRRICARAGVTDSTFHSLRHFCATWLLDLGAKDQDVAIQLGHLDEQGHANVEHVRGTYGHPTTEPALRRLEELVAAHPTQEGSNDGDGGAPARAPAAGRPPDDGGEKRRGVRRHLRAIGAGEPAQSERAAAEGPASESGGHGA